MNEREETGTRSAIRDAITGETISRRRLIQVASAGIPVAVAGCSGATDAVGGSDPATADEQGTPLPGTVTLSHDEGFVGDTLTLRGSELPPNEEHEVVWESADGYWGVVKHSEIVGPQYQSRTDTVATVTTDQDGEFVHEWTVQEDYGGNHDIEVRDSGGSTRAKATFALLPQFEIDRTRVPLGETFTITSHALGPSEFATNYQVAWDNGLTGLFTAVSSRGRAEAELRAAGPPGEHLVEVHRGYLGVPFLNPQQSPFGDVTGGRQHAWVVEVTEPESSFETMWSDPHRDEDPITAFYPDLDEESEATLEITPNSGVGGTDTTIRGRGFPANTGVDLVWYSIQGNRVTGQPIEDVPMPDVLPAVTTDGDGAFELDVTVPPDKGGTRPIVAEVDGSKVAATGFVIQPTLRDIAPSSGPAGTDFVIEVEGIGWAEYANTYALTWDNHYLGYSCGMDEEEGIVEFNLKAAGQPGTHFIDLYPAMYKGDDAPPDMYSSKAHLTYRDDHMVREIPALHFTFEVTE